MKKKLFILGIGGLTGSKLAMLAKEKFELYGSYNLRNPKFNFMKTFKLDVTNIDKTKEILSDVNPDIIINTCSLNNVDYCEIHKDEAKKINVQLVKELYKISNSLESKFVYLSTDSVFDGTKKIPYIEKDVPNPINVYGHTKLAGEKITLKNLKNLVVRISVLYGWLPTILAQLPSSSMKPTNFGQWLITKLQSNEKVHIITDEYSSPITADDFARSTFYLIQKNCNGIFHSAPLVNTSRYNFSKSLAKSLGLNDKLIIPTTTAKLGRNVKTGRNKALDSKKLRETNFQFLTMEESFKLLKEQIKNDSFIFQF